MLAGSEQSFADSDQTLSDADQTSSDSDQRSADKDQLAADRDQAASDRRLAAGADPAAHKFSHDIRQRTARQRAQTADARQDAAQQRDAIAYTRDLAALARDLAADARDLAHELEVAEARRLIGARDRAAGLIDLDHELERCRRTSGLLVVAYIEVIGRKALDYMEAHSADDELRQRVVALIKKHLRPYDLIIRLGGDEFLCATSNMTLPGARQRFGAITADLGRGPRPGAVRTGFAQLLTPTETAGELIARAERDLLDGRRRAQRGRPQHGDDTSTDHWS